MANVTTWTDVDVFMESAIATAKTITGISKAAEGVVTATAHGYANGDYVLIKAQGMAEVNGRVFRVKSVATDTFVLEGENTTDYGTFTSGSAQKLTFGTTLSTLTSVSGSGGEFDMIDTTTIHDKAKSSIPGLASATEFSFESVWDVSDAGLQAAKAASNTKAQKAFMIVFSNSQRVVFYGYIGAQLIPGGSTGGMVTTSVKISAQGALTAYAS